MHYLGGWEADSDRKEDRAGHQLLAHMAESVDQLRHRTPNTLSPGWPPAVNGLHSPMPPHTSMSGSTCLEHSLQLWHSSLVDLHRTSSLEFGTTDIECYIRCLNANSLCEDAPKCFRCNLPDHSVKERPFLEGAWVLTSGSKSYINVLLFVFSLMQAAWLCSSYIFFNYYVMLYYIHQILWRLDFSAAIPH